MDMAAHGSPMWTGGEWLVPGSTNSGPRLMLAPPEDDWRYVDPWQPGAGAALRAVAEVSDGFAAVGTIGDPTPNVDDDQESDWTGAGPPTAVWWLAGDPTGWADLGRRFVAELPHDGEATRANGIITLGSLVIVYGERGQDDVQRIDGRPAVWISDSSTWDTAGIGTFREIVDSSAPGRVMDATVVGDEVVFAGTVDSQPAVWTLDEGANYFTGFENDLWATPAIEGQTGYISHIASGPAGLVATAKRADGRDVLYVRSANAGYGLGRGWEAVEHPDVLPHETPPGQVTHLGEVVAHGDGFLVNGAVGNQRVIWRWSRESSSPSTTAPPTTEPLTTETEPDPPPPTTGFVPDIEDPTCFPSVAETFERYATEGRPDTPAPVAAAIDALAANGIGERWDAAGACVIMTGMSASSFDITVVEGTLPAALEADTLAVGADGAIVIDHRAWEPIPGEATWTLASGEAPGPDTTEFDVVVTETGCSNGRSAEGRIAPPEITYGATTVELDFTVYTEPGAHTCPGNRPTPYHVALAEALGNRTLAGMSRD
jgi:hypothetical protein